MTDRDFLVAILQSIAGLVERETGEPVTFHIETKTDWIEITSSRVKKMRPLPAEGPIQMNDSDPVLLDMYP